MDNKYKKLLLGNLHLKVNKNVLEKSIKRNYSEKITPKWESPFKGHKDIKTKFLGK